MFNHDISALANEYYQFIDKPVSAKEKPQFALCMIGLIGSGKSTVLKKMCQHIPLVRASGDEVRKLLHDKGLPEAHSQTLANIGGIVIDRLVSEGYRVAYDNDFANPVIRAQMLERNRSHGIPIIWIRITPPEEYIVNKLTHHEPSYLFKDSEHALASYRKRKALHKKESANLDALPYEYTFDPSAADLDRQVEEAAAIIKLKLRHLELANM